MTELPEVPAEHERGDRIAALGQVAGELMHDLSNLIAVLEGRSQLALSEARAGRTSAEQMERITEVTDEMSAMVRDTMDVLRGRGASPEVAFRPVRVAEQVISRFMSTSPTLEIRLISSVGAETRIAGRSSFFSRTLANLLTNAARHARGQIRVEVAPAPEGDRRGVRVSVEDDGAGVTEALVPSVFRPLVRADQGGTGLGLSSVEWAVRQLGGEVTYRKGSELGGACFELLLPVAEAWRSPALPRAAMEPLAGHRVGVIDDQAAVRNALSRLLRRLGATVEEVDAAESVRATVEAVLRAQPDAVLLDLRLGAHTGLEVWRAVREAAPETAERVIFMSGLAPANPLLEAAAATGRPILNKPFDLEELAEAVGAAARRS